VYIYTHEGANVARTLSSREVIRLLEADGWQHVGTSGDHWQFRHPKKPGRVTVTHPRKDLPLPLLRSIYRQAGLDWSKRS
jgi:predicted RNA binding protein YcfA (HicA-like mRNA interferase family)